MMRHVSSRHVFSSQIVDALVDVAAGDAKLCAAPREALELLCWLMRTGVDASLLERHSPKNGRLAQREAAHGLTKTFGRLRASLRTHISPIGQAVADAGRLPASGANPASCAASSGDGPNSFLRLGRLELLSLLASAGAHTPTN